MNVNEVNSHLITVANLTNKLQLMIQAAGINPNAPTPSVDTVRKQVEAICSVVYDITNPLEVILRDCDKSEEKIKGGLKLISYDDIEGF